MNGKLDKLVSNMSSMMKIYDVSQGAGEKRRNLVIL